MLKTNLKPLAISAMFAVTLATGAARASESGIVLKEVSSSDSSYCHIKYMAFTAESLKRGDPEFNPNEVIDRYGSCAFDPKSSDEVQKQIQFSHRMDTQDGEGSGGD